jgi:hypothetical protein
MRIKKSVLQSLIQEEFLKHIKNLLEAPKNKKGVSSVDAQADRKSQEKPGGKKDAKPTTSSGGPEGAKMAADAGETPPSPKKGEADSEPKELPATADKADDKLEKDVAGEKDKEADAADVTGSKIADDVSGKTIQSLTMEPKSKILPGAQEITITFNDTPDPLKILVTKTGSVKFFWKGIHNSLGEAAESPATFETNPGIITKKTNHPDKFSMSNDEYLKWIKDPPNQINVVSAQGGKPIAQMNKSQIQWALKKASFMKGMSKGLSSEAEFWIAPVIRGK